MKVKHKLELDTVFSLMDAGATSISVKGIAAPLVSSRLTLFHKKGTTCVSCGLKATHFQIQKPNSSKTHHLGMYAGEVMFTQDHILAKCLGGSDDMSNLQVLCDPCNSKKSKYEAAIKAVKESPLDWAETILAASMVRVATLTPKVDPITYSNQLNEQLLSAWQGA